MISGQWYASVLPFKRCTCCCMCLINRRRDGEYVRMFPWWSWIFKNWESMRENNNRVLSGEKTGSRLPYVFPLHCSVVTRGFLSQVCQKQHKQCSPLSPDSLRLEQQSQSRRVAGAGGRNGGSGGHFILLKELVTANPANRQRGSRGSPCSSPISPTLALPVREL